MKNAKKHFIMMLSLLTGLGGITASAQNKIPKMLEKPEPVAATVMKAGANVASKTAYAWVTRDRGALEKGIVSFDISQPQSLTSLFPLPNKAYAGAYGIDKYYFYRYADDPENSKTAHEMGIIMGTSHHEPMARNHQEWVRKRSEYGAWDYASNQQVIDRFFREGMERAADTEDLITIGMRGDGDTPMGGKEGEDDKYVPRDEENMRLMEKIFRNQRRIIKEVTGKAPEKRPQVWAIYKEVQRYYDMGLRVPDDVIMLLSDDNWGDVRRLPDAKERKHSGGWGMYYHVDYVGAPRNSKWLNVTPVQNMWEQLQLTYSYGVDKLWILNVGDLKPMEYPITLFMNMAWNPERYAAGNLLEYTRAFCAQQFGEEQADEAMRILNLYCKYNGRVTPEMLDKDTYHLASGEWRQVADEYVKLEAEALRQYLILEAAYRDAYRQLILFPVQAMANLYEMYYAQAMNHKLYQENNPQANEWADKVEKAFRRDAELCREYNEECREASGTE